MRIAVLCNDRIGLPALQLLAQNRLLLTAATTDRSIEMVGIMQLIRQQAGIPTHVFTRKNFETELLNWLEKNKPDVVFVKTFPFRIPKSALTIPKFGFINFHYAPLPEFRGSNPLFWMIRNGITEGGVTIHRMDEDFDTGPILLQQKVNLPPDSAYGICAAHLAHAGANLCMQLIQAMQSGTLTETPQDNSKQHWYGRPQPTDLFINWNSMPAAAIKMHVNACNPWLKGAPTRWKGIPVNITDCSLSDYLVPEGTIPGTVIHLSEKEGLIIACKDGKAIKAESICLEEGFFAGTKLLQFGMKSGERLGQ